MRVLKSQSNVPVNIRVEGVGLLRNVVLEPAVERGMFFVLTGKRGRPRILSTDQITSLTVLQNATPHKPVRTNKTQFVGKRVIVRRRSTATA